MRAPRPFRRPTSTAPRFDPPGRRVFAADDDEARFRSDGFLVVQLFDPDLAREIESAYVELGEMPADEGVGIHELMHLDRERKRRVDDLLRTEMTARVARLLDDYDVRATAFIRKPPGEGAEVEPHVDPSFIDETTARSVMIWCSLGGVEAGGGVMYVVPGSHRVGPRVRGHLDPRNSFCDLLDEIVDGIGTAVPLRPGQAVIFDHSLVHYVEVNGSTVEHVVAQAACTPAGAPMTYVLVTDVADGNRYRVDEEFFMSFPLDRPPPDDVLRRYDAPDAVALPRSEQPTRRDFLDVRPTRRRGGDPARRS